jgi:uncharacterized DUF497 family protein
MSFEWDPVKAEINFKKHGAGCPILRFF